MAGDRVSGVRVVCATCGAEFLLPAAHHRAGARIRCPDCGVPFRAYDPAHADAFAPRIERWAAGRPGGAASVRESRAAGRFFAEHGASLTAEFADVVAAGATDPAALGAFQAALAALLGPGAPLFG